uniref:Uncharacterized protein n=1 Tax=Peronospora matthiolae TaxID=2874970 RepID=A0AAV1UGM4_9STRA
MEQFGRTRACTKESQEDARPNNAVELGWVVYSLAGPFACQSAEGVMVSAS